MNSSSSERWQRLAQMIEALRDADSLEEVIQVVRISARAIVGADGITFVKREGDTVHYVAEDAVGPLWKGQHFPVEFCISGLAMLTRSPIIIPDVFRDTRVPHHAYQPTFVRSMAMFPVGTDEPLAAIGAYWARAGEIDAETIELLAMVTKSTAAVLEALDLPAPTGGPAPSMSVINPES